MDLIEVGTQDARASGLLKAGHEVVNVTTGKTLKIETYPGGSEILDAACPEGKAWSVQVDVTVTETDA